MKIQSKATNSQTIIAEDVAIDGNVLLNGNVTIYGEIKGSVKTNGAIQLAKSGKIYGDVEASMIQINGYIEGDAFINGPAELLKGCELVGNPSQRGFGLGFPRIWQRFKSLELMATAINQLWKSKTVTANN